MEENLQAEATCFHCKAVPASIDCKPFCSETCLDKWVKWRISRIPAEECMEIMAHAVRMCEKTAERNAEIEVAKANHAAA